MKFSFTKSKNFLSFLEILGPNKDVTNIDVEINEAEEFLTTDQLNIIRSIVEDESKIVNVVDEQTPVAGANDWDADRLVRLGLRPTLESLGLRPKNDEILDDETDATTSAATIAKPLGISVKKKKIIFF